MAGIEVCASALARVLVPPASTSAVGSRPLERLYVDQFRVRNSGRSYVTLLHQCGDEVRALPSRAARPVHGLVAFDVDLELNPSEDRLLVVPMAKRARDALAAAKLTRRDDLELLLQALRTDIYDVPLRQLRTGVPVGDERGWIEVEPVPDTDIVRWRPRSRNLFAENRTTVGGELRHSGDSHIDGSVVTGATGVAGPAGATTIGGRSSPPSRTAYTRIDCPGVVVRDREFELVIGLGPRPDAPGDKPLRLPVADTTILDVHVSAPDWLRLRPDEVWRHQLVVSRQQPHPTFTVHPTVPSEARAMTGGLDVLYRVESRLIGRAERRFAIADAGEAGRRAPNQSGRATMTFPVPAAPPVDLEITVQRNLDDPVDVLRWSFDARHGISSGREFARSPLGDRPEDFAAGLVALVDHGGPALGEVVRGVARTIAGNIPSEVWDALRQVARRSADGVPTVLIHTSDPHVPWELAALDEPLSPASAGLPPILGAQARMGRWNPNGALDPVPHDLTVTAMAVVEGGYRPPLRQAAQEAKDLRTGYRAVGVKARMPEVLECLRGVEPVDAEALHFAVHGEFQPGDILRNGLRLADQEYLQPLVVQGMTLSNQPLVFLNACQVASGSKLLGTSASLADAFLLARATGVVAPLWSVHDDEARAVALEFYRDVLGGLHPAEFVRRLRASVDITSKLDRRQASRLAYQFFGHPKLTVRRQ